MVLLEYLRQHFPTNKNWTDQQLQDHFMQEFGVYAKVEGRYWQFKYGTIQAKWEHKITHQCRGTILYKGADWELLSRPFDKFFNQHEPQSVVSDAQVFNSRSKDFSFVQKVDGTCIQVWWDTYKYLWRASTLGRTTPLKIFGYEDITFDGLFWKLAPKNLKNVLRPGLTYIFELCTKETRVITEYQCDQIFLIGVRNIKTGELAKYRDLAIVSVAMQVSVPIRYRFVNLSIASGQQARKWVEQQSDNKRYGKDPEGFVIYDQSGPVCKIKGTKYLNLLHASGAGNIGQSCNCAIKALWNQNLDDIYHVLPEQVKQLIERIKQWARDKIVQLEQNLVAIRSESYEQGKQGQKKYAAAVVKHVDDQMFHWFMFRYREQLIEGQPVGKLFTEAMREVGCRPNYMKFWKTFWVGDLPSEEAESE